MDYTKDHKSVIRKQVRPQNQWVADKGISATVKWDGACCCIKNGFFYKRYNAKKGKKVPSSAIPCITEPDPVTGHWPHWVRMDPDDPGDKWFYEALRVSTHGFDETLSDGTYEAVGEHFQGNPYKLPYDCLIKHGMATLCLTDLSFEYLKFYLSLAPIEGIVFWGPNKQKCKLRRKDFGYDWPCDNILQPDIQTPSVIGTAKMTHFNDFVDWVLKNNIPVVKVLRIYKNLEELGFAIAPYSVDDIDLRNHAYMRHLGKKYCESHTVFVSDNIVVEYQ